MLKEEWKDIVGYEGLYKVSNFGNVYSVRREKVLKPLNHTNGYLLINLYNNSKHNIFYVHRLVANAFITNSYNKPDVNHKDEDKTNNCTNNLEWVTRKENCNFGTGTKRQAEKPKKKFVLISSSGIVRIEKSATDMAKRENIDRGSISKLLHGRGKTVGGFRIYPMSLVEL